MNKKIINSTDRTPEIAINDSLNTISIKGVIIPENPINFFADFNKMVLEKYNNWSNTILEFDLEYFNTGAAKYLFDLFKKFEDKSKIQIHWYYEKDDEDILETGQDYEHLTKLKFKYYAK
jgi:hypothetical protein